jgi:hypothetical protein
MRKKKARSQHAASGRRRGRGMEESRRRRNFGVAVFWRKPGLGRF